MMQVTDTFEKNNHKIRSLLFILLSFLVPIVYLSGLRWISGETYSWHDFLTYSVFIFGVFFISRFLIKIRQGNRAKLLHLINWILLFCGLISIVVNIAIGNTIAAWIFTILFYSFLLYKEESLIHSLSTAQIWVTRFLLAIIAGLFIIAVAQIESRFSEEEFYVGLQAILLSILWLLLLLNRYQWDKATNYKAVNLVSPKGGIYFLIIAILGLLFLTLKYYQVSFFPPVAPSFPGISKITPFLCGKAQADTKTYDGKEIYFRILNLIEANPYKQSPEYGMLALNSEDDKWANGYRERILEEARGGLYTTPVNSVKHGQYKAALTAYIYARITDIFPILFNQTEKEELSRWFIAINRRAQTIEWVDWLYAMAFRKLPQGPYENQETGAGLIAILESQNLSDPTAIQENLSYLSQHSRGWEARFRYPDDAIAYQVEWLHNAFFQSEYSGNISDDNLRLSFEWLMLQTLPDGKPPRYNQIVSASIADTAYWGADILQDDRFLWISGRATDYLMIQNGFLTAKPDIKEPLIRTGQSPTWGSCLIFGDSGLPIQLGPLAPDKIVFRDGWKEDSTYLLLNLRFTGWHRYKATNTISLFYQAGRLIGDYDQGSSVTWLPVGRSLFRDKRIPREHLNGFVVERSGMSAIVQSLVAFGSHWAQDPPYYCNIEQFEHNENLDISRTTISGWRGWQQSRTIYFYHNGPIVVLDQAEGPKNRKAAIVWNLFSGEFIEKNRIRIRSSENPVDMILLPLNSKAEADMIFSPEHGRDVPWTILYQANEGGRLSLVTIFLKDHWLDANVEVRQSEVGNILQISLESQEIEIPLKDIDP